MESVSDSAVIKPKLFLRAYRAFGDFIYTAPVLPFLFEKYDVYIDCSAKVWHLISDDPRFKEIAIFVFENFKKEDYDKEFNKRYAECVARIQPDKVIDLNGTIELSCIAEVEQPEFHYPVGDRRVVFGSTSFYQAIFAKCEIEMPIQFDTRGLYFDDEQEAWAAGWAKRNAGKFLVTIPFSGSTSQKRFPNWKEITDRILERYPEAIVYLAGEESAHELVPVHNRIRSMCGGRATIKQIVHLMKYMSCVVGPETFILAAAGMWGTPKIMYATASSVYQLTHLQRNDFSFQAPIWCSPCHRAIYKPTACETHLYDDQGEPLYPACTTKVRTEDVMNRIDKIYKLWKEKVPTCA